jgi:hypothetical protein
VIQVVGQIFGKAFPCLVRNVSGKLRREFLNRAWLRNWAGRGTQASQEFLSLLDLPVRYRFDQFV